MGAASARRRHEVETPYSPQRLVGCQETPPSGAHPGWQRYNQSESGQASQQRYRESAQGLANQQRYRESAQGQQYPNARFTFNRGDGAQRGTFKGVWLNAEHTEWALEKEQQ